MTVHMVRIYVEPPKGESEEAVNSWVENHTQWNDGPVSHELTEATADLDDYRQTNDFLSDKYGMAIS